MREYSAPNPEVEEDTVLLDDREKHWKGFFEDNNKYKLKVHALRL